MKESSTDNVVVTSIGQSGDVPLFGEFNGSSGAEKAVFRPSTGTWHVPGISGLENKVFGAAEDVPVTADFDGDGLSDLGVYRATEGMWYVSRSSLGYPTASIMLLTQDWGNWGDQPLPADYDGDAIDDFAVWRPTTGTWHILESASGKYNLQGLGAAADRPIPAAYTKKKGWLVNGESLGIARLSPRNATGGTDLYSQNYSWSAPLASLPGRSGHDAGIGISYNSLVWVKDTVGNQIVFDPDRSNVAPGFRIGAAVVEPAYFNVAKDKNVHIMVLPSGRRVEFLQSQASGEYISTDSTFAQMQFGTTTVQETPEEPAVLPMFVTDTDGNRMRFGLRGGLYRCTEILDRNGNQITYHYNELRLLTKITDTLGREINISYDAMSYPLSITQTWKENNGEGANVTHTHATFSYGTVPIDTSFTGVGSVVGPPNGTNLRVLTGITYGDGSSTGFQYNGYGQVTTVNNRAADTHLLNYSANDLNLVSGEQTDCPRFGNFGPLSTWAENHVTVSTSFQRATNANTTLPDGHLVNGTRVDVRISGNPTANLFTRAYFGGSGVKEGLPLASLDCIGTSDCTEIKRWSWTDWLNGNSELGAAVNYQHNPRMDEGRVGDGSNIKGTKITYHTRQLMGGGTIHPLNLPVVIDVYQTSVSNVVRKTEITYPCTANTTLSCWYRPNRMVTNRKEWGLNSQTSLLELASDLSYGYDEVAAQPVPGLIRHRPWDIEYVNEPPASPPSNLTSITRNAVLVPSPSVTTQLRYNVAGSVISKIDPLNRTVSLSYTDSFNDGISRNTFAYPTAITDPNNQSSTAKYRYDIGANVEAVNPPRNGSTTDKKGSRRTYSDTTGRLQRDAVWNFVGNVWSEHAYTRYEYPTSGVQTHVFSTLVDVNTSGGPDAADEVMSETWTDGAGRVIKTRTEHPGSTGGWTGTLTGYDILSRVTSTSVPTEITSGYAPAGDDAARGFVYNQTFYDWMNRPVRTVPSDSNGSDGKDTLIEYSTCGCAGGLETIVKGPVTTAVDVAGNTQTTKRRLQNAYSDILGRRFKTEVWDLWDSNGAGANPYSTVITTFNARDQALKVREWTGAGNTDPNAACPTGTCQETAMTYDGHGRLSTRHIPQQNAGAVTTYNYYPDDRISSVVDARGASTGYAYNNLGLPTHINYAVPQGSEIPDPLDVTLGYDNLGNRTSMTDDLGVHTYVYNELSQMTSETRDFYDSLPQAPGGNGIFTINYTYHLGGQLKSLTEPYGVTTNYSNDKVGRLTSVAPAVPYGGTASFASNAQYRAWGALKHLDYGNGMAMNQTFDNALRPLTYNAGTTSTTVMDKDYEYYPDGSLKFVDDNQLTKFDRLNIYDFTGRIKTAKSGSEASGGSGGDVPYRQAYTYNAFGDMTARTSLFWGNQRDASYSFTNNRVSGWTYDTDGRAITTTSPDIPSALQYDAAGRLVFKHDYPASTEIGDKFTQVHDGDGGVLKRTTERCVIIYPEPPPDPPGPCEFTTDPIAPVYFIRSSMLGGEVISEVKFNGSKMRSFVFAGGAKIAELTQRYTFNPSQTHEAAQFYHVDAAAMSQRVTRNSPETLLGDTAQYPNYIDPRHQEYDPMSGNAGTVSGYTPIAVPPSEPIGIENDSNFINGQVVNVTQDGIGIPMSVARNIINTGNIGGVNGLIELSLRYMSYYRWAGNTHGDGISTFGFSIPDLHRLLAQQAIDREFIDSLKPFLRQALDRPSCKAFIEKYVGGADLFEAFEKLLEQGGMVQVPRKADDLYSAFAIGTVDDKTARIEFNYNPNPYPTRDLRGAYVQTRMLVLTLIHELIHLVKAGGGDYEMHKKLFAAGVTTRPVPNPLDYDPKTGKSKSGDGTTFSGTASAGFSDGLNPACLPPTEDWKKWWATAGGDVQ